MKIKSLVRELQKLEQEYPTLSRAELLKLYELYLLSEIARGSNK